ncbi:ATP-binding protein [bacterium]|nr:ATP-binding protein [bacterium]
MPTSRVLKHQEIPNDFDAIHVLVREILDHASERGYDENAHFALRLALDEALANAYDHGNRRRSDRRIRVTYEITPHRVKVVVGDEGDGFDHHGLDDPREDAALDRTHGRGIFLIQQFMSEVRFNEKGNEITLVYRRERGELTGWPGLKIWESAGINILDVPAELPACYSYVIGVCLGDLLDTGHRRLVLDLSRHSQLEPETIAALVGLSTRVVKDGARLVVVHADPRAGSLLHRHGLSPRVDCRSRLAEALELLAEAGEKGERP